MTNTSRPSPPVGNQSANSDECYYCHKKGHCAQECPDRPKFQPRMAGSGSNRTPLRTNRYRARTNMVEGEDRNGDKAEDEPEEQEESETVSQEMEDRYWSIP